MTQSSGSTTDDNTAEPLWMACRKGGDVISGKDLTLEEQQDAHRHHNQLYGVET